MKSSKNLITLFCFIFLFNIIQSEDACATATPSIKYDCFKLSNATQYCCYNGASSPSSCSPIDKTHINIHPELDCGISEDNYGLYEFEEYHPKSSLELPFLSCGEKNPKEKGDCLEYSELTNSCCFFKNSAGATGCFYIGKRYSGDLEEKTFVLDGVQLTYECKGYYYESFNFYLIFFFVILFF